MAPSGINTTPPITTSDPSSVGEIANPEWLLSTSQVK